MRLLLDTHVAIWAASEGSKLPGKIKRMIADPRNDVFVSVASVWEIAIKFSQSRRRVMPFSGSEAIRVFRELDFQLLDIRPAHAAMVDDLPSYHSDPFDRLILAQALVEPMRLITHDAKLTGYSDVIISW